MGVGFGFVCEFKAEGYRNSGLGITVQGLRDQ